MKNDLSDSFERAKQIDDMQKELLKKEVYKDIEIVNFMKQEMLWGSSKKEIFAEVKKDFKISEKDIALYYEKAVELLDSGKWI